MFVPALTEVKVPMPLNVTISLPTIPFSVPVIVAVLVPS
jgi:hypothetical protein